MGDEAITSELNDNQVEDEEEKAQTTTEVKRIVRDDFKKRFAEIGLPDRHVYLVSSLRGEREQHDFRALERDMGMALKHSRAVSVQQDCPICFETYADYDGNAGHSCECKRCSFVSCSRCAEACLRCPQCKAEMWVER